MKRALVFAAAVVLCASSAHAAPVTFSSRAAFDLAAPNGLMTEDFESGLDPPPAQPIFGPLTSSIASPAFAAGSLLHGFTMRGLGPGSGANPAAPPFILIHPGVIAPGDPPTKVVGPNFFQDDLEITFSGPQTAIGFDLFSGFAPGSYTIDVFSGAALIDSSVIAAAGSPLFDFYGIISDVGPITRIHIQGVDPTGSPFAGELIDNLSFRVPEPSTLALFGLGGLGLFSLVRRRRKRRANTA